MNKKAKPGKPQGPAKPAPLATGTPVAPASAPRKVSIFDFRVQALILVVTGFIFYGNTFSFKSAFDDRMAITSNQYVLKGVSGIPDILTKDAYQSYLERNGAGNQLTGGRYRPLSLITFAIEQQLMGTHDLSDNADAHEQEAAIINSMPPRHVVNVLLYILSGITLLIFLRSVVFPGNALAAFTAAFLFIVHPLHTEVVANVKSRDEILSVLCITATFIFAFRYIDKRRTRDLLLALTSFFMALLSKEYAVMMIVLLPMSFFIFRQKSLRDAVRMSAVYLIPLALYLLMRLSSTPATDAEGERNVLNNPYLFATGTQQVATKLLVLLQYIGLLFYPHPMVCDYSYKQIPYTDFSNPLVWASAVIYAGLIAAAVIAVRRRNILGFALLFFLLNLLLVSNFLVNIGAPMGERLAYHSSVGLAIALAYLLAAVAKKLSQPTATISVIAIIGTVCCVLTISRNNAWANDQTLFLTDITTSPNSVLVNNNAGAACMANARDSRNDPAKSKEWFHKAIGYFDHAIALYPGDMLGYVNRGLSYYNVGEQAKALADWDTVRAHEPQRQSIGRYLSIASNYFLAQATTYLKRGANDSAVYAARLSIEAMPINIDAWRQLSSSLLAQGDRLAALHALENALQVAPNDQGLQQAYQALKQQENK